MNLPGISASAPSFLPIYKARLPQLSPALYNAAAKTMIFILAGGAAFLLYRPLAFPLFTIAGMVAATRLVIKIGEVYHSETIDTALLHLARFRSKHKFIQAAALIAILATAIFSWKIACALSVPFGVYAGAVVGLDYYLGAQEVRRREERAGILRTGGAVYLA